MLVTILHTQNFIKIQSVCSQDIKWNTWILYLSMHIQNFIKIHRFVLKILRKNTFLYQSRAITLLFIDEFNPCAIFKLRLPDTNVMAKYEANRSKPTR